MKQRFLVLILTYLSLTACIESEDALFGAEENPQTALVLNYAITDSRSLVGQLTLTESDSTYTVVTWSDEKATARRKPGQTFQLFPAPKIHPPFVRSFGEFDYYWIQADQEDGAGFDYELIGIARDEDPAKRIVFRWGQWTLSNELFSEKLRALKTPNNEPINCGETCVIDDKVMLNKVADIIVETDLAPIRAYVPRSP